MARRSLREFVKQAWPLIEPTTPLMWSWHLDAVCEHLQAVTEGRLRKLLINVPPRTGKSSLVSVLWPAWEWASRPSTRWLFASYSLDLSTRDSVRRRRVVEGEWYRTRWGKLFELSGDQNVKREFENTTSGYMIATSVGGTVMGRGADRLVIDDPHQPMGAESEVQRAATLEWYDATWSTRANDPKSSAFVVIMQRLAEGDLSGHLLKQDGWEHLRLPMEFDNEAKATSISWVDPRSQQGELLWPERFGEPEVAALKKTLGDYAYTGQMQQRPYPRGGGMFNVDVLRHHVTHDGCSRARLIVRGWDLAATEKRTSKRTAGVRLSKDDQGKYWIEHVVLGKWAPDKRNQIMLSTSQQDGNIKILHEHEGGSGGEDQALSIARLLAGHRVESIKVTGDKVTRADAVAAQVNAGNVWVVDDGTWDIEVLLHELEAFPSGDYKDQVDALSLAFNWLAPKRLETTVKRLELRPVEKSWSETLRQKQEGLGVPLGDWRDKFPGG